MLEEESKWIAQALSRFPPGAISPCINLGSSTLLLRKEKQPHIVRNVLAPLVDNGIHIIHSDIKEGEGIDVAGDIYNTVVRARLASFRPKLILCTNILEHLRDPQGFANACSEIISSGGYILVSAPYSYPYHPDPIDTMFRPSPEEIAALFPEFDIVTKAIVIGKTYCGEIASAGSVPFACKRALRGMARAFVPFVKFRGWVSQIHRFAWLFRPYKVSIVLLSHKVQR